MLKANNDLSEKICRELPKNACILVGNGFNIYQFTKKHLDAKKKHDEEKLLKWDAVLEAVGQKATEKNIGCLKAGLNDIEKAYFLYRDAFENNKKNFNRALKTVIDEKLIHKWDKDEHCGLLDFAQANNCHILTTNFDDNIERYFTALGQKWHYKKFNFCSGHKTTNTESSRKSVVTQGVKFWKPNSYFWNKAYVPVDAENEQQNKIPCCGVWHIHGRIGGNGNVSNALFSSMDYCGAISYFRKFSSNIISANWKGTKTWLYPFLERPLIIVGLGLSSQELFIRHLLCIRHKYRKQKSLTENQDCFFELKQNQENDSPKDFLGLLGFNFKYFDSYQQMYELK